MANGISLFLRKGLEISRYSKEKISEEDQKVGEKKIFMSAGPKNA